MSYIHYREKVFHKKLSFKSNVKTNIPGKLKCANIFTDPRAWSLNKNSQRSFILDAIVSNATGPSLSEEDINETTCPKPQKIRKLLSVAKAFKSRFMNRKVKSAERLVSIKREENNDLERRLVEAGEKIKKLVTEKEGMNAAARSHQLEIDNLRLLVHDIQDELCYLRSVKAEHAMLKSEANQDFRKRLSNIHEEVNSLNNQLELYKEYKSKYDDLRSSNETLKEEHDEVKLSLKKIEWNNGQLMSEMEELKAKIGGYECRELAISNAMVDKEVLRERLQVREEKICSLMSFLDEQEVTIQDLVLQLQRMASNMAVKEGSIVKQMQSLKTSLFEKTNRIFQLEDKLHSSELLIRELENLRDHFRLSNCAMTENMQNYKKQFNMVVSCSKKLLAEIESYKQEVNEKNLKIQKLSIFPITASTVVQFSQLLNILKSTEDLVVVDKSSALTYIPAMRRIVEKLKAEIIGEPLHYPAFEIYNSDTQTEFLGVDRCLQNELLCVEDKIVEASFPERYYFDYHKSLTEIQNLRGVITSLEESFYRVDTTNHSLEKKILTAVAEKSLKEKEVVELRGKLESVNLDLKVLYKEIDRGDSLLCKSLHEMEIEKGVMESTSEIITATLDRTQSEYDKCIEVFENILKYKEDKIKYLEDYICSETTNEDTSPENEYITLLENEIKELAGKYANEKQNLKESTLQVGKLQAALSEKMEHFKIVQGKLLRAEKIFEHLNSIENQCMTKYEECCEVVIEPADVRVLPKPTNINVPHRGRSSSVTTKPGKEISPRVSKDVLSILQKNNAKKRHFKKTINQLRSNICRIKSVMFKLRKQIKISENMNKNYSTRLSRMEGDYKEVMKGKEEVKQLLKKEKSKSSMLETSLEKSCGDLLDNKRKHKRVEKVLIKILKRYEKNSPCKKNKKESKSVNTDSEISVKDQQVEVNNLKTELNELSSKNLSLVSLVVDLEERVASLSQPEREDDRQTATTESQTDMSEEPDKMKDIQAHYESVIESLQKDQVMAKDERDKQHISDMIKIRDAYEKDIRSMRKTNRKQIIKLQDDHKKEIEELKSAQTEQCKYHVDKEESDKERNKEVEGLKEQYDSIIKNKETEEMELVKEIKELKEDVGKIIAQKQKDDALFNEKIKVLVKEVKKKFKRYGKKLKKAYENEIIKVNKKHDEMVRELSQEKSVENSDVECQTADRSEKSFPGQEIHKFGSYFPIKETQAIENFTHLSDIFMNKQIDINFRERFKYSIKEATRVMIPRDIMYMINKLRTIPESGTFCFNADTFYQKYNKEEKVIVEELRELLNMERIHSTALKEKLAYELNNNDKLKTRGYEMCVEMIEMKKCLKELGTELIVERCKYDNLKKSFISMANHKRTADKLDSSLERLQTKLQTVAQCEKRLSDELEKDRKMNERIKYVIETDKFLGEPKEEEDFGGTSEVKHNGSECDEVTKDVGKWNIGPGISNMDTWQQEENVSQTDLKVFFIQRCGVRHEWNQLHFDKKSTENIHIEAQ